MFGGATAALSALVPHFTAGCSLMDIGKIYRTCLHQYSIYNQEDICCSKERLVDIDKTSDCHSGEAGTRNMWLKDTAVQASLLSRHNIQGF